MTDDQALCIVEAIIKQTIKDLKSPNESIRNDALRFMISEQYGIYTLGRDGTEDLKSLKERGII